MRKLFIITLAALIFTGCNDKKEETAAYTVTFDANGGSPTPQKQIVKAGETAAAPADNPSKQGYVFLFWSLDNAVTAYNFQIPVKDDITLTAKWEEESKVEYLQVTWQLNGGAWAAGYTPSAQVAKGGTLSEPSEPTKAGSTFVGWYKEAALTNKVYFPYSVTSNITLYAKWETGGSGDCAPAGYQMFTSISALKTWLAARPVNTVSTAYKVGLKDVNLDAGNNWNDLGLAIGGENYVDLNLQCCTSTGIPDGRNETQGTSIVRYGAFVDCKNLVAAYLPNGLKIIGDNAFIYCNNLIFISLPNELTEIHYAFAFSGLQSVSLPDGLKIIQRSAFDNSDITSIIVPGSVKDLSNSAFYRCSSLKDVVLNNGVETIGEMAFADCSLENLTLPASLKTIGIRAFESSYKIKTITIPASVTSIGNQAFSNTSTSVYPTSLLEELIVLPTMPPTLGTNVFTGMSASCKIKVPAASLTAYQNATNWKNYSSQMVANQ